MTPAVEARDGGSLPFCPPLGDYFKETFPELRKCRTHFHGGREYLYIPLVRVCKAHENFSFERFCTIVKTYLAFRGGAVHVELDIHEVCHHIDIKEGQYVDIVRDIKAPKQAIEHFDKRFKGTRRCSTNLVTYNFLKIRANIKTLKHEDQEQKRKFEVMRAGEEIP